MNIALVLKVAGVGLIVSVAHQILSKNGRDEQAALVTVAGIVIAMLMLTKEIASLIQSIKSTFGI
ncbi:MAG: stage III sporulation protein AC [Clostridia bacterium]|nr:stage III sporulation protein AC [Clostridia bacterium]MBQ7048012.1 stage III sporulation protein AC [Clostridia bacterium]